MYHACMLVIYMYDIYATTIIFIMFRFIIRATTRESERGRRKESLHSSPAPMPRRFRGLKR